MTASLERFLGRSPDSLTLAERTQLAGKWIALEVYTPKTLPLRKIEAIGDSAADCIRSLRARGLDVTQYEFLPLKSTA
jgi:hypothetical protein